VRPLRSPFVRALVLVPCAAAVIVAIPALHFFRSDMAAIGFIRAWGFSIGQAIAGIVIVAFLAARAFSLRPSVAGALYGLGGGLIADAGMRLYCEYTQPEHVILAHGGAIAASIVAGVVLARITPRS